MLNEVVKNKYLVSIVFLSLIFSMYFIVSGYSKRDGFIVVRTENSEIKVEFSDGGIRLSEIVDKIMSDPADRSAALGILRMKYNLYDVYSQDLISFIRSLDPESSAAFDIREVLQDMDGPFSRTYHNYYDIYDISTAKKIVSLSPDDEISKILRDAADRDFGVFEQKLIEAKISVVSSDLISYGFAAVCHNSPLRGKDLVLNNPDDINRITSVFTRNSFPCRDNDNGKNTSPPLIQVNHQTAVELFGEVQINQVEDVLLWRAKTGMTIQPITILAGNKSLIGGG